MDGATTTTKAHYSFPSLIALAAAVGSFATGAFWGFILAVIAIVCGIIGVLLAFSSRIRGGLVSIVSLLAGVIGIIVAIVKAIRWLA